MKIIDDKNFDETLNNNQVVLVDCFAPWCRPCHLLLPILEHVATQHSDVAMCKLNIDENPLATAKLSISSIPTIIFFLGGKEVKRMIGLQEAKVITETLQGLK